MDCKDDSGTVVVMTMLTLCARPWARRWQGRASDDAARVMVVMTKTTRMTQGGCSVPATAVKAVNQRHRHRRHSSHEGRVEDADKTALGEACCILCSHVRAWARSRDHSPRVSQAEPPTLPLVVNEEPSPGLSTREGEGTHPLTHPCGEEPAQTPPPRLQGASTHKSRATEPF